MPGQNRKSTISGAQTGAFAWRELSDSESDTEDENPNIDCFGFRVDPNSSPGSFREQAEHALMEEARPVLGRLGLAHLDFRTLRLVDLTNRAVAADDVRVVAPFLRAPSALRSIKLGYNQLGDEGALCVAAALEYQVGRSSPLYPPLHLHPRYGNSLAFLFVI